MTSHKKVLSIITLFSLALCILLSACSGVQIGIQPNDGGKETEKKENVAELSDKEVLRASELVVSAFDKLRESVYFEVEAVTYEKSIRNGETEPTVSGKTKIIAENHQTPETHMCYTLETENDRVFKFYSDGYDTYGIVDIDSESLTMNYKIHKRTNSKIPFGDLIRYSDGSPMGHASAFMSKYIWREYGEVESEWVSLMDVEISINEAGETIVTYTTIDDKNYPERNSYPSFAETTETIVISKDGYPVSLSLATVFTDYLEYSLTITCSNIKESGTFTMPDWFEEVKDMPVAEYRHIDGDFEIYCTVNDDGTITIGSIDHRDKLDHYIVPSELDGRKVTGIDAWHYAFSWIADNGTVILPDEIDLSNYRTSNYGNIIFFTNAERPESFYHDNFYFKGEWEMKDGKSVPVSVAEGQNA